MVGVGGRDGGGQLARGGGSQGGGRGWWGSGVGVGGCQGVGVVGVRG